MLTMQAVDATAVGAVAQLVTVSEAAGQPVAVHGSVHP
jgi:hypothetical protein